MAIRITCISKASGQHENPYVAISQLGWTDNANGQTGRSTREDMYRFIAEQRGEAYVQSGGSWARVVGAVSPYGTRYVKTEANSTERDNLLHLPECV